jgi:two-component system chemotaxis response regulator CheY
MAHRHPSVLIVEDNDDVREVLAFYIAREGYGVETARDGAEALDKMRVALPCIVVLDLAMPGMTGVEFRHAQLADDALKEIPVLVCSATIDVRESAEKLGAVAFAEKPVEVATLMATIREHCLK